MKDISELIYETCKTYLLTQGRFILILEALIGVIMVLYFGWINPLKSGFFGVALVLMFSLVGIPAALFMAVAVTVLRTLARQIDQPDEILRRLNDELVEQNPRGMFVTLQCLVFDTKAGRVLCAGAGHHTLAVLAPNQPPRLACESTGRPIGLMPANPIAD